MADLGNQKIKDTYQLVLQADASGNLQKLDGTSPSLIINSAFTYNVGTLVDGYVLKSNGSGVASWGALNADIYLSAATLNGTTLELDTTSGNTLSVDLSSLEGDSYWSANTNGSISPSGTSTNIRISGDTIIKGDLSLTSNNASLTLPYYGTLKAKNSAGTTRTVLYNIGDTGVVFGDTNTVTTKLQGTNVELEGEVTVKDDINISGDTFIKGNLGVTGLTNSNIVSAVTVSATTVKVGTEASHLTLQNQYIKWKTSNRIFISTSPTSSAPNRLFDDWRLQDNDSLYFGTGNDLSIHHNGTNSIIDNNTGTLQILASAITIGDTTSEVTINDNLVVDEDLTVNGTTFYVDSSNTKVGVGTTSPTHELTVSGGGAWVAWTEPTQIDFVNGASFFGYVPSDATVPGPLTLGGTTVRALVDGVYYYGTTTSPFFLNGRGYWGVTWAGSNVTLTDAEAANCIAYGGVIPGNDKYFSVAAGDVIFQVSGSSVMSGSTDLVDIFASSAITNQDVYWTATTDGTSISPSGSNVTTTVRMSGDTHIKGNLGVTGSTFGNVFFSDSAYYAGGDRVIYNVGSTINLGDTDAGTPDKSVTIAGGYISLNAPVTASSTLGVSGDTNINGVLSGVTDARFGGNLGVSGNTYTSGAFIVGNATLNTSQLDISSGDFTLDVEGDITLDANGADIILSDNGTDFGRFKRDSSDFIIKSEANNNDIVFRGQDAGVTRDALVLDMSEAGTATFNNGVNISGVTSGRTDAVFGGNLGVSGNTYLPNFQNGTTIIQCSFSLKTFTTNNWASHPIAVGGLNSEFWTQDTGVDTLPALYQYYNTQSPSAGNPSPSQGAFCAPATGKLRKIVFNGANSTGALKGDDLEIEIARAPVTDGQSGLSYTQLTGITHTLPDTTAKRFIIDCNFGGSGVDVAANDVFLVAFKTTESSNAFIRINLSAYFEYPLPLIT